MIFESLNLLLTADVNGWKKGTKSAEEDIERLGKKTKGFFDEARQFSRTNPFGQSLRMLAGGGALAVVDMLASKLTTTIQTADQISQAVARGDATWKEFLGDTLRTVPVLGDITKLFDAIRESITHEKAQMEAVDEVIKDQNRALETRNKILQDSISIAAKFNEEFSKMRGKRILDSMPEGVPKEIGKEFLSAGEQAKNVRKEYDDAIRQINADLVKVHPDLQSIFSANPMGSQVVDSLKKQMAEIDGQIGEKKKSLEDLKRIPGYGKSPEGELLAETYAKGNDELSNLMNRRNAIATEVNAAAKAQKDALSGLNKNLTEISAGARSELTKALTDPFKSAAAGAEAWYSKLHANMEKFREENRRHLDEVSKQLTEESLTPVQKFLEEMKKVDTMALLRRISPGAARNLETKYTTDLQNELRAQTPIAEYRTAPTHEHFGFGSVGKVTAMPEIANPVNDILKTVREQLAEQRKQTALTQQQIRDMNNGTVRLPM